MVLSIKINNLDPICNGTLAVQTVHWFVFNDKGDGESVFDKSVTLHIPAISTPIVDIKNMNRSLAILSKDHISILNVKLK